MVTVQDWHYPGKWASLVNIPDVTYLEIVELLSVVQSLHADLQTPPPLHGSGAETLSGFQGADAGVELRTQACARRL